MFTLSYFDSSLIIGSNVKTPKLVKADKEINIDFSYENFMTLSQDNVKMFKDYTVICTSNGNEKTMSASYNEGFRVIDIKITEFVQAPFRNVKFDMTKIYPHIKELFAKEYVDVFLSGNLKAPVLFIEKENSRRRMKMYYSDRQNEPLITLAIARMMD